VLKLVGPQLASGLGKDPECNPATERHDVKLLSWQWFVAPETARPSNPYVLFGSLPSWIIKQQNDLRYVAGLATGTATNWLHGDIGNVGLGG